MAFSHGRHAWYVSFLLPHHLTQAWTFADTDTQQPRPFLRFPTTKACASIHSTKLRHQAAARPPRQQMVHRLSGPTTRDQDLDSASRGNCLNPHYTPPLSLLLLNFLYEVSFISIQKPVPSLFSYFPVWREYLILDAAGFSRYSHGIFF
jgi:hypothetical protein